MRIEKPRKSLLPLLSLLFFCGPLAATDDHLLICEAVLTPTSDEYIEIVNPTGGAISLDNYYLSDDADYALLPGASGAGPAPAIGDFDFIAQFPPGSSIGPGEVVVVAFDGAGFFGTFGVTADFEILATDAGTTDMVATDVGASAGLTNSGEHAVLFYWDGMSDLVQDVDMVNLGTPSSANAIGDKTGVSVDGPDADMDATMYAADSYTMPQQATDPGFGFSTKRISLESSLETTGMGNGLTGDDETSEDISATWDSAFTAPDPGVCDGLVAPVPAIYINEVDADTAGTDVAEFVELFGPANASLDGLVLVFFNGSSDTSYAAYDLDGFTLDANGFFVVGNAGVPGVMITFASNGLQNGADAVALYTGDDTDFPNGTAATDTDLIDALVYDTNDGDDSGLIDVLTPGQAQLNEDELGDKDAHSNARVPDGGEQRVTSTFTQQEPTPGASNVIPETPAVVINEVDADTAGTDVAEFVELYGPANASLDGLVLVFFNGSSDTSYAAFDLDGFSLDANGFFVVGNAGVPGVTITFASNGLQNGADGVALYEGDDTDFPNGTAVTDVNLIDALVYDTNDGDDTGLIDVLTPGQAQLNEDELGDKDAHSNSRVPDGGDARVTSTYTQQAPTPGASNVAAPMATVVINEVDADQTSVDSAEFVELYGEPNTALDGLVVVFFNGSDDASYAAYDLDGFSLNAEGFFVLGNTGVTGAQITFPGNSLQNGADAVALFMGDATDFPEDTPVTNTNLIDAVVYDTNDGDDSGLLDVLTPGQPQVNEDGAGSKDTHSNSRIPDGGDPLVTSTYVQQDPTPNAANFVVEPPVINEVDADTAGTDVAEFVELFGNPNTPLDGFVLVFFNGSSDTSYAAYDLDGFSLNAEGFFVVGNAGVPGAMITFASNGLQNGADAVALYNGDATDFPNGTAVTATNLIDALVYDTNDGDDTGLIDVLTPGQAQLNEDELGDKDNHSNSRVPDGGDPRVTSGYTQQVATPNATNVIAVPISIADIQGDGLLSPFDGNEVITNGNVVTALTNNGFYMQMPDPLIGDGVLTASAGIYVFTDAAPTVSVGDIVDVTGTVDEFFDFTEIITPTVDVVSSGNPLPAPISFNASLPSPVQPQNELEYERFESMLIQVSGGVAAGPTDRFGNTAIIATNANPPLREAGIAYPGLPGLPIWDGDPEIFELDTDGAGAAPTPLRRGASITAVTGPLTYTFGEYQIEGKTLSVSNNDLTGTPVRDPSVGEFSVASQNMLRLFSSEGNYQDRLAKFSLHIRNFLKRPDILAVQEVGGLTELQDLAARLLADEPGLVYSAHLLPGSDPSGINVGFLVKDTVTVNNVSQIQPDETFMFSGSSFQLHDRPPLLLDATANNISDGTPGGGFPIQVICIHNRSLIDLDTSEFARTKRLLQAQRIAQEIQTIQTNNPDVRLLVLGDFNGFEFTDGYVDVLGQITGNLDPLGALVPGSDEVDPDLVNLTNNLAADERYSFVLDGTAQALDHALVSSMLEDAVSGIAYARTNADFPNSLLEDPSTALRNSDHDGLVVYIGTPGVVVTPLEGLVVDEDGLTATFTVVLESVPNDNVTFPITVDDETEGAVNPTSLTFTPANWNQAQTVTVSGVPDISIDFDAPFNVMVGPSVSNDLNYDGYVENVSATNFNVDQSSDYTIDVTVGGDIIIYGPSNAFNGLYVRGSNGGDGGSDWIFLENINLDDNGVAVAVAIGQPDSVYGVGGPDGSIDPTTGFATVPTLGEWGMFFLVSLLMLTALRMNRRQSV